MKRQNCVILRLSVTIAAIQRKLVGSGLNALGSCDGRIAMFVKHKQYSSGAVAIYGCPPISARRFFAAGSVMRIADQSFRNWLLAAC